MTFVEKYGLTDPGPMPALEGNRLAASEWLKKHRRYVVAVCLDTMMAETEAGKPHTTERTIALVLGNAYLDDALSSHNPLRAFFG